MANPNPKRSNLKPFPMGMSGNPGGKPIGARNRIQGDFMREIAEDFAQHGKDAIQRCRDEKPEVYLRAIASMMPKEIHDSRALEDLTEDELVTGIAALQLYIKN